MFCRGGRFVKKNVGLFTFWVFYGIITSVRYPINKLDPGRNKIRMYDRLGKIAFIICVLLFVKFIGRVSKNKKFNNVLLKIHKPLGIAAIAIGAIHGVMYIIKSPQQIVANILGILVWILMAFLAVTFYTRKSLESKWFKLHRIAAVLLIAALIAHVVIAVVL